jgi:hypothetical protein
VSQKWTNFAAKIDLDLLDKMGGGGTMLIIGSVEESSEGVFFPGSKASKKRIRR